MAKPESFLAVCRIVSAIVIALVLASVGNGMTQSAPTLGVAGSFGVLAGLTVSNTGPTVINGDLGISPGSAITGFPPGIVVPPGATHATDGVALQAQNDVTTAYNDLAGESCEDDLTDEDLGGQTLEAYTKSERAVPKGGPFAVQSLSFEVVPATGELVAAERGAVPMPAK